MKKEFPNNYNMIAKCPAEWFEPIDFVTFMSWKIDGWEMPTEYHCMIRARNHRTNKVTEHVYKSGAAAKKKVQRVDCWCRDRVYCMHTQRYTTFDTIKICYRQ